MSSIKQCEERCSRWHSLAGFAFCFLFKLSFSSGVGHTWGGTVMGELEWTSRTKDSNPETNNHETEIKG